MTSRTENFDIAIVGGGMVGASLAVALAPLPIRIALIEAHDPKSSAQPSFDDRSTAIANGSRLILDTMGVWDPLADQATPILEIHISDRGRFGASRICAVDEGVPALGYVVPNRVFGATLWRQLEQADNVELFCPARLISMQTDDQMVSLSIESGETGMQSVGARLVAAADGARSVVRDLLGIEAATWDYRQTAIVANLATEKPHGNIAYERFTDAGPMAILPAAGRSCGLVWSVPGADAGRILALNDEAMLDRLQDLFGYRLGHLQKIGKRLSYPLSMVRANEQVRQRVAIIGNAAHGLHPVAGQGFNLSLRDVAALAELVVETEDPGSAAMLERYRRWRSGDQKRVMGFTDGLIRLFGNPLKSVMIARNAGLILFDLMPGAKGLLARQTMGRGGDLPRLARGVPLA